MGASADIGLAEMIYEELKQRGLARPSKDGLSIPLHPVVRSLILVLLSQALCPTGKKHGLNLIPVTDRPDVHQSLIELLDLPLMPSAGHVVSFDLQTVGGDLGPVPLDEVLDFRNQYGAICRKYMRDLERYLREISGLPRDEQVHALEQRQKEITDTAGDLRQITPQDWAHVVSFAFTLAGAVWTTTRGDLIGGLLTAGAEAANLAAGFTTSVNAYSYLFAASRRFP